MTNTIKNLHKAVVTLETAINNSFTDNFETVYKPYLAPFKARNAYSDQQKGVKGKHEMMLSYDVKHGFRVEKDIWEIPEQDVNRACKLARYTDKELLELVARIGGNTIGTICKNISLNKTATTKANSKPKTGKADSKAKTEKSDKSFAVSNPFLRALNQGLSKASNNMTSHKLAQIILDSLQFAPEQYPNVEVKQVKALLQDQVTLANLAKSA